MLYLEDYLEMIEHLPQELRDRFTEIRELDLSVQNDLDTLDQRVRNLFGSCRRGEMNSEQAMIEYTDIQRGFEKTAEEADEKVSLTKQMYELVNRYIKKLDTELHKFKCELEADNKGITEILEKRSLELDTKGSSSSNSYKDSRYRVRAEKRWASSRDSVRPIAAIAGMSRSDSAIQAALNRDTYNLNPAGSVLAAAASQAIAATQQLSSGRRTASMKASYEALSVGEHAMHAAQHDHGIGPSTSMIGSPATKRPKHKKSTYTATAVSSHSQPTLSSVASRSSSPTIVDSNPVQGNVTIEEVAEEEWTYDPNEPRYCICNQVSYGDMVACDNQDCPYEWFHYPCVGITAPPKGKWYCPQCSTNMRRNRTNRKN